MSGWTDTPLSEEGRREARRAAEALRREPSLAAVYASPLTRARDTAAPICAALGLPLRIEPRLREIFCGAVDGRTIDEVRAGHPDAWARNLEERHEDFRWPEGESYREFRGRCLRALRALAARHRGQRVVLVTHAGFISQAFGWLEGLSCARWGAYRPANGSISRLRWDPGRRRAEAFDERAHLVRPAPRRPTPPPPAG